MPLKLKWIARICNIGLAFILCILLLIFISKSVIVAAIITSGIIAVFLYNQYLIEKSAFLLSEEDWLKGEIRKLLLRRKLQRLSEEDQK